jgi:hypothetical protein
MDFVLAFGAACIGFAGLVAVLNRSDRRHEAMRQRARRRKERQAALREEPTDALVIRHLRGRV